MSNTDKMATCVCGEHFVAAKLSGRGYVVALPRAGIPSVDLLVSSVDGKKSITVQVKTAKSAGRGIGSLKAKKPHWEWAIGANAEGKISDTLFYAFVDLDGWPQSDELPKVFIASSKTVSEAVKKALAENWSRLFWYLSESEKDKHYERWDILENAIKE